MIDQDEQLLRTEIENARKVWQQRVEERDRAKAAEELARYDMDKAARKLSKYLSRRR